MWELGAEPAQVSARVPRLASLRALGSTGFGLFVRFSFCICFLGLLCLFSCWCFLVLLFVRFALLFVLLFCSFCFLCVLFFGCFVFLFVLLFLFVLFFSSFCFVVRFAFLLVLPFSSWCFFDCFASCLVRFLFVLFFARFRAESLFGVSSGLCSLVLCFVASLLLWSCVSSPLCFFGPVFRWFSLRSFCVPSVRSLFGWSFVRSILCVGGSLFGRFLFVLCWLVSCSLVPYSSAVGLFVPSFPCSYVVCSVFVLCVLVSGSRCLLFLSILVDVWRLWMALRPYTARARVYSLGWRRYCCGFFFGCRSSGDFWSWVHVSALLSW